MDTKQQNVSESINLVASTRKDLGTRQTDLYANVAGTVRK